MIELKSVTKVYANSPAPALQSVNLSIQRGEFVAIVGPSGSGKSTLLNLIGCLDRPTSGHVVVLGEDTRELSDGRLSRIRNRSIGFVFQAFNLVPELTVHENVELPLIYAGVSRKRRDLTSAALTAVGISHCADQRAGRLSGGEQQRAAIARALVSDPPLILADEPTGSIDAQSADHIMRLLSELHDQGRTIVIVTHNQDVAASAQRVVIIEAGAIPEFPGGLSKAAPRGAHLARWAAK